MNPGSSARSTWSSSNPFLDERGRTARLMVDLTASLMGRKVFDRVNRSA